MTPHGAHRLVDGHAQSPALSAELIARDHDAVVAVLEEILGDLVDVVLADAIDLHIGQARSIGTHQREDRLGQRDGEVVQLRRGKAEAVVSE